MAKEFTLSHCFPMMYVPDVTQAQKFYRDKLGFNIIEAWNYGEPPIYGSVMLEGTIFHFAEGELLPNGTQVIVYVKNIQAFYEECKHRGLELAAAPEAKDYGETQFGITDLNGYKICFTETTGKTNC